VLVPIDGTTSIAQIEIENLLGDDASLGGQFVAADVTVQYKPTQSSSAQVFGPFRLTKRGEFGSKVHVQVLGAPNGASELRIVGRAHWSSNSFQDLAQTTFGPIAVVQLDASSFSP